MTDVSVFHIFVMVVLSGILILLAVMFAIAIGIWNVVRDLPHAIEVLRFNTAQVYKIIGDQGLTIDRNKTNLDTLVDQGMVTGHRVENMRNLVVELYDLATKKKPISKQKK